MLLTNTLGICPSSTDDPLSGSLGPHLICFSQSAFLEPPEASSCARTGHSLVANSGPLSHRIGPRPRYLPMPPSERLPFSRPPPPNGPPPRPRPLPEPSHHGPSPRPPPKPSSRGPFKGLLSLSPQHSLLPPPPPPALPPSLQGALSASFICQQPASAPGVCVAGTQRQSNVSTLNISG